MMTKPASINLIINADDYGYFPCINQGIIEAAQFGILTATGILANSSDLSTQLKNLDTTNLDLGVHLNLTFKAPLSELMRQKLARWNGNFPDAQTMSLMILSGKISVNDVRMEWQLQIDACQPRKLVFLNSHEHIHMLPVLFPVVLKLAQDYNIPHVRFTRADWHWPMKRSVLFRNTMLQVMQLINRSLHTAEMPIFLGLTQSGKLDLIYLEKIFSKLKPGQCYELMCHPGRFNPQEITDSKLIAYHEWEAELALLKSPEVVDLLEKFAIRLSHYS